MFQGNCAEGHCKICWLNEVIDFLHVEQSFGDPTVLFPFNFLAREAQTQVFWPSLSKSRDTTPVIYPHRPNLNAL